jgi:hypothetical protein
MNKLEVDYLDDSRVLATELTPCLLITDFGGQCHPAAFLSQ